MVNHSVIVEDHSLVTNLINAFADQLGEAPGKDTARQQYDHHLKQIMLRPPPGLDAPFDVANLMSTVTKKLDEAAGDAESVGSTELEDVSESGGEVRVESPERTNDDSDGEEELCKDSVAEDGVSFGIVGDLMAVATVLEQMTSPAHTDKHRVTNVFELGHVPELSVHEYLQWIYKYFQCSDSCIMLGIVYVDRFLSLNPEFVVTSFNVYKLILTSMVLAAKFFDDTYYCNTFYAKVGGIDVKDLNAQEAELLKLMNWRLNVKAYDFEQYRYFLAKSVYG